MTAPPSPPPISTIPKAAGVSNTSVQNDEPDLRSALMDSIKKGAVLRKVDANAPPPSSSSAPGGGRNDLLSEIRKGVELRPVSEEVQQAQIANRVSSEGTDALADALRRALQERYKHTQSSDDESNSSENDNEWED